MISYEFMGWKNSTGAITQDPLTVNGPSTYVASYTPQLSIPAIPGFPIEAILTGMIMGMTLAVARRRTRGRLSRSLDSVLKVTRLAKTPTCSRAHPSAD
jgi:hypothetical protein